jgi:restriction endonuclease S subunit
MNLSQVLKEPLQNGIFKTKDFYGSGVSLVNVFDLYQGLFIDGKSLERINITSDEQKQYSAEKGDVFFCRSSIKPEGIAWTNCILHSTEPMTFECHIIRVRPNKDIIRPLYLSEFCKTKIARQYLLSKASVTTMATIDQTSIQDLPIIIPPYNEQKRLEDVLICANNVRQSKLREADELLEGMDAFVREEVGLPVEYSTRPMFYASKMSACKNERLDPQYHNPVYKKRIQHIKSMDYDTLENIIEFSSETWNQQDDFVDTFPYIEISGVGLKNNSYLITQTPISEAPGRARMIVRDKDIIVSTTRPHRGAIATIRCEDGYYIASTGFCILRRMKRDNICHEYLQWIMLNDYVLQQFLQRSSGGNYPAITQDEMKKVLIPIPDKKIQKKIVKESTNRMSTAHLLRHEANIEWTTAKEQFERELLGG